MSEGALPPWSQEQSVMRDWNRAIKAAGKVRVLAVIAPVVAVLNDEVRSTDVGEPRHRERYGDPRERADAAARAVELLASDDYDPDSVFADDGTGLTATAASRLRAAGALVLAMKSTSKFEVEVMLCLGYISACRPELLERISRDLA